jgi:hypothetical protein
MSGAGSVAYSVLLAEPALMKNLPPFGADVIWNWCALSKFSFGEPSSLTMRSERRFSTRSWSDFGR